MSGPASPSSTSATTFTVLPTSNGQYPDAAHLAAFMRRLENNALHEPFGLTNSATRETFAVFPVVFDVSDVPISYHDTIIVRKGDKICIGVVVRAHETTAAAAAAASPSPSPSPLPGPLSPIDPMHRQRSHSPCQ